ncbi:MAG: OmpH family outer membrane protein [Gammaproteobacteria bacterium]|nr:OmpH family outer membrane protein [Gammaproteobacteria bacterium]MBU0787167.1 OmpH family outer membrane protein [Gammaproteobacteria bacterium]MBU0814174.1 OmpH family outer membrane protein [Gammaproteobacteria bacterium]MBU1786306.1 OmpH family outer membrane protein [Gammaproteobacteria bacterium]
MKYFSRQNCAGLLLAFLAFALPAHAEEFKIGFVNIDRILKEPNTSKAAQAKLVQEFAKREKELADQGAALKAIADKFERDAPTLSESQRNTRQKQFVEQDRDFQRKRREFQEDLNARKNEELQQVLERANRVIRQFAESEKFDVILQEAVYINAKHDVTDKVIKLLNAASVNNAGTK